MWSYEIYTYRRKYEGFLNYNICAGWSVCEPREVVERVVYSFQPKLRACSFLVLVFIYLFTEYLSIKNMKFFFVCFNNSINNSFINNSPLKILKRFLPIHLRAQKKFNSWWKVKKVSSFWDKLHVVRPFLKEQKLKSRKNPVVVWN